MTNNDIYRSVIHLLAETEETAANGDYDERFPYILALFCGEAEELDEKYRLSKGLPRAISKMRIAAVPEEDFPLSDEFASAAVYYTAAMLIADENPEFSDRLFEKYTDRISAVYAELPCELERIKNIYN